MTRAFIAMPFARDFHPIYQAIRGACESLGIITIRIDEVWAREDIYKQIEEEILKADFIIADFTGDRVLEIPNPNVVHEAAIAKSNKKYILLMAQDHTCLPFDWRTRPALIYQNTEDGLKYLKERLVIGIQALLKKEDFALTPPRESVNQNMVFPGFVNQNMLSPGFVNSSAGAMQVNNRIDVIENLLRARQGNIAPIISNELPQGFRQQDDCVICEIDGSKMVRIAAAKFSMGGEDDEDQQPIHEVYLTDYLLDIFPITNAQYTKFIQAGGYNYQGYWNQAGWSWRCAKKIEKPEFFDDPKLNGSEQPVVGVSWYEAMAYATWRETHLPSEAQWEYAARGQDRRIYPWGEKAPNENLANYRGVSSSTTEVGKFEAGISPLGCYDMAGNVWEWCYDWYGSKYYGESPSYNPMGPQEGKEKICRGGSWTYEVDTLKMSYRFSGPVNIRNRAYGFRCARSL